MSIRSQSIAKFSYIIAWCAYHILQHRTFDILSRSCVACALSYDSVKLSAIQPPTHSKKELQQRKLPTSLPNTAWSTLSLLHFSWISLLFPKTPLFKHNLSLVFCTITLTITESSSFSSIRYIYFLPFIGFVSSSCVYSFLLSYWNPSNEGVFSYPLFFFLEKK